MKLAKSKLKQIIREEVESVLGQALQAPRQHIGLKPMQITPEPIRDPALSGEHYWENKEN